MKNLWKKITGVSLGAVMALGVGVSVMLNQQVEAKAESIAYSIAFKDNGGADSSTAITTDTAVSTITESTHVTAIASTAKAYLGKTGYGLKFGSSSAVGNVTLTLDEAVTVTKYVVTCAAYGTDASTFAVDGTNTTQTGTISTTLSPITYAYASATSVSSLILASTKASKGRMYVTNVDIYTNTGTSDVVTAIAVTPTTASYEVGNVIAAPTTVTATLNGVEGQTYAHYSAAVGTLKDGTFTSRASVVFDTTPVVAADNCVRISALDPNTEGGSAYEHADIALTVTAPVLTGLAMNVASADVVKGTTLQLSVTPTPAAADASVTWSVSPSGVVTVDENGLVTAGTTTGSATVTATSTTVATISTTCAVTVIEAKTYNLVTSTDQLVDGAKVVIAGVNDTTYTALSSTQNTNNRGQVTAVVADSVITPGAGYAELTLGVETKDSTTVYTFLDASGYLYAASTSSNYLRSQATNDDNGRWTVAIADGAFTITAQGTNTHNVLQYNSSSSIFSAYTTASQKPVQLYIKSSTPTPAEEAAAYAANFLTATEDCTTSAAGVWAAQKAAYLELSTDAQAVLTNATYSGAYADATDTQKCVWRYDLAVAQQALENFMSRAALSASGAQLTSAPNMYNNFVTIIVIVAIVNIAAVTFIVLATKKRRA